MADITMCVNAQCELNCFRKKAILNEFHQSYACFEPKDDVCEHFIQAKN